MTNETFLLTVQVSTTAAIFAALWVYYRQLQVMRGQIDATKQTAQSQVLFQVVQWLSLEEARHSRKTLIGLKRKKFKNWTRAELATARKVCVTFDLIEILIMNNVIPSGVIELHWGNTIRECRAAADVLISETRKNGRPDAWKHFDDLHNRAM
jgi:hypothetical protein